MSEITEGSDVKVTRRDVARSDRVGRIAGNIVGGIVYRTAGMFAGGIVGSIVGSTIGGIVSVIDNMAGDTAEYHKRRRKFYAARMSSVDWGDMEEVIPLCSEVC